MLATLTAASFTALLLGTYTNEEQVYFAREAGRTPPPWIGLQVEPAPGGYRLRSVDAFGAPGAEDQTVAVTETPQAAETRIGACIRRYRAEGDGFVAAGSEGTCRSPAAIAAVRPAGLTLRTPQGADLDLDRSQPFTCWTAIRKAAPKADGGEDWSFRPGLKLHDAGGRVRAASDEPKPQQLTLRMRNVAWPSGPNRPSLVLYVHTDDPDRAVAYSWADPDAKRVGLNLRWMQASCTRDGAEK